MSILSDALRDYGQLVEEGAPLRRQFDQFKSNVNKNIPSTTAFKDPAAMSEWSLGAALNAPALGTIRPLHTKRVLANLRNEGYDTDQMYYHGSPDNLEPKRSPTFFTTDKSSAKYFANQHHGNESGGKLHGAFMKKGNALDATSPEGYASIVKYADEAGVKDTGAEMGYPEGMPLWNDISLHSPYEGTNSNDLAYVPKFREALAAKDINQIKAWDTMFNDQIPVSISLDPSSYKVVESKSLRSPTPLTSRHSDLLKLLRNKE